MPRLRPDRELDRRIAALALPALGSIAAEPAYSLADTAIVGHLGRVPLDSLAIATTALTMTAWMAIFLTTATTSAVAGLAAARDTDRAARSAGAAYLVAAAGGMAVAVAVIVAAPLVAVLLGAHGLVLSGAVGYLRASAAGLPFLYVSYAGNGHLIGLADTRTPLWIAVTANVLNVALELLLVYGVHLGLLGSAWGTVTAQVAAAAEFSGDRQSPIGTLPEPAASTGCGGWRIAGPVRPQCALDLFALAGVSVQAGAPPSGRMQQGPLHV